MDLFHDHQNFPGELLPGDGAEEAALDLAEPVIVESQVIFEKQGLIVLRDLFSNGGQRVTKRITFTPTDQDIRIRDTMHEFDIMTSLGGHPNILQCYGMAQFDICCDLYIEAADISLSGALQTLTFHKKWSYLSDICAGLAAIHQSGVIHFDLKCDNVLLVGNRAKIADFGVSLTVAQVQHPEFHPGLRGTANFLAPEIIREGATAWGFHCDLWSLGALIYELFHNIIPFHQWDMEAILFFTGRYFAFCDENPINPEVVPHQIAGLIQGLTQILPQSRVPLHQVQAVLQSLAW